VDVGGEVVDATLGPEWSTHEILARAPSGWRSGLTLAFPGSRRDELWLREVRVDRGRAWPSLRVVTCVTVAGLLAGARLAGERAERAPGVGRRGGADRAGGGGPSRPIPRPPSPTCGPSWRSSCSAPS
jgi:hypothetical protein